jgi:hypothetical protein
VSLQFYPNRISEEAMDSTQGHRERPGDAKQILNQRYSPRNAPKQSITAEQVRDIIKQEHQERENPAAATG